MGRQSAADFVFLARFMVLLGVGEHVGEHTGDVVVFDLVEDLFVAARAADQPGGAEQAEVVADQRLAGRSRR